MDLVSHLDDGSVDFVFTDPPYNVGKDYELYKDDLSEDEYANFMIELLAGLQRVSKHGIGIYIGGTLIKKFWAWIPSAHLVVIHKRAIGPRKGKYHLQYHGFLCTRSPVKYCKDLWDDIRLPGEGYFFREPRYDHPGLTSLIMTSKILDYFTNEHETVLDPFMGTGTTAVACLQHRRNFIGSELNPQYINIANQRLKNVMDQTNLQTWL